MSRAQSFSWIIQVRWINKFSGPRISPQKFSSHCAWGNFHTQWWRAFLIKLFCIRKKFPSKGKSIILISRNNIEKCKSIAESFRKVFELLLIDKSVCCAALSRWKGIAGALQVLHKIRQHKSKAERANRSLGCNYQLKISLVNIPLETFSGVWLIRLIVLLPIHQNCFNIKWR